MNEKKQNKKVPPVPPVHHVPQMHREQPGAQENGENGAGFNAARKDLEDFVDIPIKVNVLLGKKMVKIRELLDWSPGSLLVLDHAAGERLFVYLEDTLFARGEVMVIEDNYCVRITEINDPGKI